MPSSERTRSSGGDTFRVVTARTADELERFRGDWGALPWQREEAELDYLLTRLEHRPGAVGPFAALLMRGDEPVAGVAARLETRPLATNVGFRTVYAPSARVLQIVDGGIALADAAALPALTGALIAELAAGRADLLTVPPLEIGSPEHAAFAALGGPLERQRFITPWPRRLLVLPPSFEEFLASRSRKLRFGIRYDAKKLQEALGDSLAVDILRAPGDFDRLVHDLDAIAATTYQRAVGGGFADTPEQRALARVGLENGWVRAYVLSIAGRPAAYWLCATYHETILLRTTGFDPAYARHRIGIYLLMRVIEDACADPALRVLDLGPGDADYKRHYSSESHEEQNLVVFAPTLRARRINATRTVILGGARLARRALDATNATSRFRAAWRRRLRS